MHKRGNKSLHEEMVKSLISSSTIETRSPDFKGQQSLLYYLPEEEEFVDEDKA
jgi:hypothetical protein